MELYTKRHKHYCGIDLHTKRMYVCVMNDSAEILLHKNMEARAEPFLQAVKPFRDDLVVTAECTFSWYWLADMCEEEGIEFVLGHALAMKSVNGGKVKNDKADSENITHLLRGGNLPVAYAYPKEMRSTRDLLRRRMHLMRKRSELLAHVQNSYHQHNLKNEGLSSAYKGHRDKLAGNFEDESIRLSVQMDIETVKHYDKILSDTERYLIDQARVDNPQLFSLLKTIPGIGDILALVILYEIHDIKRFANVGKFLSYARMVKPKRSSDGKAKPGIGSKQGNAYLKWAFSEASVLFLRNHKPAKAYFDTLVDRYGKGKALSILGQKLARATFQLMRTQQVFDARRFLQKI